MTENELVIQPGECSVGERIQRLLGEAEELARLATSLFVAQATEIVSLLETQAPDEESRLPLPETAHHVEKS